MISKKSMLAFLIFIGAAGCGTSNGSSTAAGARTGANGAAGTVSGTVAGSAMEVNYAYYGVSPLSDPGDNLTGSFLTVALGEKDLCALTQDGNKTMQGRVVAFELVRPKAATPGDGNYVFNQGAIEDDALSPTTAYGSVSGSVVDYATNKPAVITGGSVSITTLDPSATSPAVGTFNVTIDANSNLTGAFTATHCAAWDQANAIGK